MEQEYGPTDNGEYLTPFEVTVFYNPSSLFESAIALACDRAQLIECTECDNCNYIITDESLRAFVHPSPRVIMFVIPSDDMMTLIKKKTNEVRIFQAAHPYSNDEIFGLQELYLHIKPHNSSILYAMEHLIISEYPEFMPTFANIKPQTGKDFVRTIRLQQVGGGINSNILAIYESGFKCYQMVDNLVSTGTVLREIQTNKARSDIANGKICQDDIATQYTLIMTTKEVSTDVVLLSRSQLSDDTNNIVVICYIDTIKCGSNEQLVWNVTVLASRISALSFLYSYDQSAIGCDTSASTLLPVSRAQKLIPILV